MKIRTVGDELFYADQQTDVTKLRAAFRNFANAHNRMEAIHCFALTTVYYVIITSLEENVIAHEI